MSANYATPLIMRIFVLAALCIPLSGCDEYLARRESIAFNAGDAVRTNIATHVIDPWPRSAYQRRIAISGDRAIIAMERYRNSGGPAQGGQFTPTPISPGIQ